MHGSHMHTDPRWPAEFRLGEAAVALRERTEEQLAVSSK